MTKAQSSGHRAQGSELRAIKVTGLLPSGELTEPSHRRVRDQREQPEGEGKPVTSNQ